MNADERAAKAPKGHTVTARRALDAPRRAATNRPGSSIGNRRWLAPAMLVAIVGAAMALAVAWALVVPIFQAPDEPTHFDYALAIYSKGGLVRAGDLPRAGFDRPYVHPLTSYLFERAFTDAIRFHSYIYVPPAYGQAAYYRDLDRGAPAVPRGWQPARLPWYLTTYPAGYYALVAGWLGVVSQVDSGAVALFFGARLLSVLLLGASLALSYAIVRELGGGQRRALLLTAFTGFFPLTTFVSAAVQPDALSFTLVSLSWYAALRARRWHGAAGWKPLAFLGTALGLLLLTKYQFFLCVSAAVALMLLAGRPVKQPPNRRWAGAALALVGPAVLASLPQLWILWGPHVVATYLGQSGMNDPNTARGPWPPGAGPLLGYVARASVLAVRNFYVDGQVAESFWGIFGWLDTPLVAGSPATNGLARVAAQGLSITIVALTVVRAGTVSARLLGLARRGRARTAARIACGNPVVNTFFAFTALMFVIAVYNPNFGLQGRYWLPVLLPVALLGTTYAPRALKRRGARRICSVAITAALVGYALAGSYFSLGTIAARYYGEGRAVTPLAPAGLARATVEIPHAVEYVNSTIFSPAPRYTNTRVFTAQPATKPIAIPADGALAVGGWAAGASGVFVTVDGARDVQAAYGNPRPDVARARGNPGGLATGFDVLIPADQLGPGRHWFTVRIVAADRQAIYDAPERFPFEVLPGLTGAR